MAFVCKQTADLVATSITLDNNNDVLTDFKPFFSLYTLPHTSVGLTSCFSIAFFSLITFDPYYDRNLHAECNAYP